ncbi:MAG: hypothetical protein WD267_12070 [Balneolales bacterium]
MTKRRLSFLSILFFSTLIFACNQDADGQVELRTLVSGSFTAGDGLQSDDPGGYQIIIVDRSNEPVDTVYHAVTDDAGNFASEAIFARNGEYPIYIQKGSRVIDSFTLILAQSDTVNITGELPDIGETRAITSYENNANRTLRRLDTQYYRIVNLINAGAVEDNEVQGLINTWADLYWSLRTDFPNTVASSRATHKSFEVLEGWEPEKTLARLNSDHSDPILQEASVYFGTIAKIDLEGLDSTLDYLDKLDERISRDDYKRIISMNKVELLYDSLRVDEAREMLTLYDDRFRNTPDSSWASRMYYELYNLAPGLTVPDFKLSTEDQGEVSSESLLGSPYLLEVVELSSRQYQSIHPTLIQLIESYSDSGLKMISIPMEHSIITIGAFYDERPKPWAVSASRAYESANLIEKFNINQLPTRLLVDAEGNIIRKYIGNNLQQLEGDIETLINK